MPEKTREHRRRTEGKASSHLIPGFHPVREALLQEKTVLRELWVAAGRKGERIDEIIRLAERRGIPVLSKEGRAFDDTFRDVAHQGIAVLSEGFCYTELEEIIEAVKGNPGHGTLLALDHITDEGNVGALMRTAAFFGVDGVVFPKDRSAQITGRVLKRSSGALLHLPVARVVNLARSLDALRANGFWIIGTAGESPDSVYQFDWRGNTVLVLGREDKGLSRGIRQRCDKVVGIPGAGRVESLNVAVACGIVLSEIARQRGRGE